MKTTDPRIPLPYFVSYTRLDKTLPTRLLERLQPHFAISQRYAFSSWQDIDILPGEDWNEKIHDALDACSLGLLLLSPGFFSKPYIVEQEIPVFLKSRKVVIPVLLKPLDLKLHNLHGLEKLQIFSLPSPSGSRAFSECTTADQKDAFALALYQAIERRLTKLPPTP